MTWSDRKIRSSVGAGVPNHTIQLPKPVTDAVADLFNTTFGRK
jgi:hypothetical protein